MQDVGVYTWSQLVARGATQSQVRRAVREGELIRLRRGWYSTPSANTDVVAAVRGGGVLGCVSALRAHGVWTPEHPRLLHVRGNSLADRRRGPSFCHRFGRPEPEDGAVDDLPVALRHAARCLDAEGFVVVCDSILNQKLMSMDQIVAALDGAPRKILVLLDKCDPRAQSGTETMVRIRLRRKGIRVEVQVHIVGIGWVDLLVGDRLILEIDGRAFHSSQVTYTEDRRRDREAIRLGMESMRFTYTDVVHRWTESESVVDDVLRSGYHRGPRRGVHNEHR